ncbi:hypothetical protein AGMMS50267_17860 [Spirochaetia bacterium]|nr:hypothetical protein AGMMS50267_17860 [Spirochaetia bacterium]
MIISVSRRCDIPRFQFDRFMEQLDAGFTDVVNPFNSNQVRHVSLRPNDVDVLVFWTRDPSSILEYAEDLESRGFRFYVMTTLTGYPPELEPNMPSRDAVIAALTGLATRLGTNRVIWRYDPVFLTTITDAQFHRRNFTELSNALSGTVKQVIISVYDEYRRVKGRLALREWAGIFKVFPHIDEEDLFSGTGGPRSGGKGNGKTAAPANGLANGPLTGEVRELLRDLADIASRQGMEMQACAEEDLSGLGIKKGACIDADLIGRLWGIKTWGKKDRYQRPFCGCVPSVDIGRYGLCPAGCVYCYAHTAQK